MYIKEQDVYEADYLMVEVRVVFEDHMDVRLHDKEISAEHAYLFEPEEFDISKQSTGEFAPNHASDRNKNGDPVRIEDITEVYLIVQ